MAGRPSEFNDALLEEILARRPKFPPVPAAPCRKCGKGRLYAERISYGEICEDCFIGDRPASPPEPHKWVKVGGLRREPRD